ncbi:MAG: 3-deoxy-manno-octulosonate cytidylyltransferase [Bacteroidota bacterium]
MTGPHVLVIIPARYGSTRLPGKPLADIGGKSMIRRVYEQARKSPVVCRVAVATDDERVVREVESFGGEAVLTPPGIPTGTDRVALAARSLPEAEFVVNVQGDEPLLEPAMIGEAVSALEAAPEASCSTLVRPLTDGSDLENPSVVKVALDAQGNAIYFSRAPIPFRRDTPRSRWTEGHIYWRHVGLYAFRREFLLLYPSLPRGVLEQAEELEQLRMIEHGHRVRSAETRFDCMPVDTPEDLERIRKRIRT